MLGSLVGDYSRLQALAVRGFRDSALITSYFAIGFAVLQSLFAVIYVHAASRRDELGLTERELMLTRREVWQASGEVAIALTAAILALFTHVGPFAGFVLFINFPLDSLTKWIARRRGAKS